jgi:hypothetical protein
MKGRGLRERRVIGSGDLISIKLFGIKGTATKPFCQFQSKKSRDPLIIEDADEEFIGNTSMSYQCSKVLKLYF